MALFPTIEAFVLAHRSCGQATWTAPAPTSKGYRLQIACPCGAVLDRWVSAKDAEDDLLYTPLGAFSS